MRVRVTRVNIPDFSTIGVGYGTDENGNEVRFGGDHRPMRDLGYKVQAAGQTGEEPPEFEIEDWQILSVLPPDPEHARMQALVNDGFFESVKEI